MKGLSSNSTCSKQQQKQRGSNTMQANYNESIDHDSKQHAQSSNLSGAYIRTFIKQLTTTTNNSSTKNSSSTKSGRDTTNNNNNMTCKPEQRVEEGRGTNPHGQHHMLHKKQVRRRIHTSRPYQERLLNMAEARKEIIAALKFHRVSMKQQQLQQQQRRQRQQSLALPREMIGISSSPLKQEHHDHHQYLISMNKYSPCSTSYHKSTHNNLNSWSYDLPQYGYQWPWPLSLPNQSLGLNLNLNFQDLRKMDPNFINQLRHKEIASSSSTSTSPSSPSLSSPLPPPPSSTTMYMNAGEIGGDGRIENCTSTIGSGGFYLHQALDEEEMAVLKSLGEQHQMEWSDALNLVTSAWWSNFLSNMDLELGGAKGINQEHNNIIIPSESSSNDPRSQDCFSFGLEDCHQDAAPPW